MKIIVDYLQSSNYCDWMNTVSRQEMEDVLVLIHYFEIEVDIIIIIVLLVKE